MATSECTWARREGAMKVCVVWWWTVFIQPFSPHHSNKNNSKLAYLIADILQRGRSESHRSVGGDKGNWMNVGGLWHIPNRCGLCHGPQHKWPANTLPGWELPGRPGRIQSRPNTPGVAITSRKLVHYNHPLRLMLGKCINKYQYAC